MKRVLSKLKMKRVWLVGSVLGIVASMAVIGGAVLADGESDRDAGHVESSLISEVAETLELDEQTVADAFADAKEAQVDETVQAWLTKMVEAEKITQAEADEFTTWFDSRPDWVGDFGFGKKRHYGGDSEILSDVAETLGVEESVLTDAIDQARSSLWQEKLDEAVVAGKITQEQADRIADKSWDYDGKRGWGHHKWGGKWGK